MTGWRLPRDDVELVDTMPDYVCLYCDRGWGECSCTCPQERFQWRPISPSPRGLAVGQAGAFHSDYVSGGFECR